MDLIENNERIDINHWYYWRKYMKLRETLNELNLPRGSVVSDVGAGSAIFTRQLAKHFPELVFWAIDINYEEELEQTQDIPNLKFSRNFIGAEVILLNDVLEHIEDSTEFLSKIVATSNKSLTFLITVPAFSFLWSGHDEYLGHYRRYTAQRLNRELFCSGIRVVKYEYLYWLVFPAALLIRKLLGKRQYSQMKPRPVLDIFLKLLMRVEAKFPRNALFGISIWCVANT